MAVSIRPRAANHLALGERGGDRLLRRSRAGAQRRERLPAFFTTTAGKIHEIAELPPFGLDDASLSAWIQPTDGWTADTYYPKGSLAGLLLDILIRDASDNRARSTT